MKGTMLIKSLNKQRCIISDEDYDAKIGGKFWFVLEPFFDCNNRPFFYYKKVDNGYLIEGEGYICVDEDSVNRRRSSASSSHRKVKYIENLELKL